MARLGYCRQCQGSLHVRGDEIRCGTCGLPVENPTVAGVVPPPAVAVTAAVPVIPETEFPRRRRPA